MDKREPHRNPENTTLTISLSKGLRARIEAAAAEDRRKVSPWVAIQLEKVLDQLEAESKPMLRVAEEAGEGKQSPSIHAGRVPVSYPRKRKG